MIVGIGGTLKGIEDVDRFSPPVPVKLFNGKKYHGYVLCKTKRSAETIANRIRKMDYLTRVTKYEIPKLGYVVWVSE
jgi:5-formaminoimidazole-4-carboxamide-1-beta-D-ribofuranosyl 5'-monophosphate synthetase